MSNVTVGTDVRKAVYDGVPPSRVIACDILPEFLDIGFKLFKDRETSRVSYFADDLFSLPEASPLSIGSAPQSSDLSSVESLDQLKGRVTHLFTSAVFHLFSQSKQAEMARKVVTLVKLEKGSLIFGQHVGSVEMGIIHDEWMTSKQMFAHSPESWKALWNEILTGLKGEEFVRDHVRIECAILPTEQDPPVSGYPARLQWSIRII